MPPPFSLCQKPISITWSQCCSVYPQVFTIIFCSFQKSLFLVRYIRALVMHLAYSTWAVSLFFVFFHPTVLGRQLPVRDVLRNDGISVLKKLEGRDLICTNNDVQNAFDAAIQNNSSSADVSSFCSSLINIGAQTAYLTATTKTLGVLLQLSILLANSAQALPSNWSQRLSTRR